MSEIQKIVEYTVLADQIIEDAKKFDLSKDDILVIKLSYDATIEDMHIVLDTFSSVSGLDRDKIVVARNEMQMSVGELTEYIERLRLVLEAKRVY